jgi:hypothetical protein
VRQPGHGYIVGQVARKFPHLLFLVLLSSISFVYEWTGCMYSQFSGIDDFGRLGGGSALSFLATMCVTLVLRCERPRLWGRTKEHLGDFYPITAIATCEKCFFRIEFISDLNVKGVSHNSTYRARRGLGREGRGR